MFSVDVTDSHCTISAVSDGSRVALEVIDPRPKTYGTTAPDGDGKTNV